MKSVKNHIMFILPLLAILLGVESFMVFERVTASYGENLREAYTILAVTDKAMDPQEFQAIDSQIDRVELIEKDSIAQEISQGLSKASTQEIIQLLPHFYTLHLNRYLDNAKIDIIKNNLTQSPKIQRVETFGQSHNANYNLYMLIRASLWTFVGFMIFTSLFLVLKQMEIWQLEHRDRMQVMEILGASGIMRSGVLFRIALTDGLIAALITIGIFAFLRFAWVSKSSIDLLVRKRELFFQYLDIVVLSGIALLIVLVSVALVSLNLKENRHI